MKLDQVKAVVGNTENMTLEQARAITALIRDEDLSDILELGFQHGVSTCYMASALDDLGRGHITSIDLLKQNRVGQERIERFLDELGLRDLVTIYYEPASYNWRMMKMLEDSDEPRFDLCYLDGAHTWSVDGLAFFLVDRLLRPGGWLVLDDVNWTIEGSHPELSAPHIAGMPAEERTTPQVRKVYELLVRTHPDYDNLRVEGDWAYAQKRRTATGKPREVVREVVIEREKYGMGLLLSKAARKAQQRISH